MRCPSLARPAAPGSTAAAPHTALSGCTAAWGPNGSHRSKPSPGHAAILGVSGREASQGLGWSCLHPQMPAAQNKEAMWLDGTLLGLNSFPFQG